MKIISKFIFTVSTHSLICYTEKLNWCTVALVCVMLQYEKIKMHNYVFSPKIKKYTLAKFAGEES